MKGETSLKRKEKKRKESGSKVLTKSLINLNGIIHNWDSISIEKKKFALNNL